MIDANIRFRVNTVAAQAGQPAPGTAAMEQLNFAAMYAGIAYTAGEE